MVGAKRINFSKFVPPETLKMHSLALSVLTFQFVKHFPNYVSLHYEKSFSWMFFKKIKISK